MSSSAAARVQQPVSDELDALARTAHPRWEKRDAPFTHWVATDCFPRETLRLLNSSFQSILDRGLSEPSDPQRLSRRMAGYDAYSLTLTRLGSPLEAFQTRYFYDHLAEVTGISATRDVSAAMHHHKIGSANGKAHNDLNPAFFIDNHKEDGVNVNDSKICHYQSGESLVPGKAARPTVRAVAMLFYLNNPIWNEGDGGETGLYRNARDKVDEPAAKAAPIDNTMLAFECTPSSYHSFISNRRQVRNSIILWLHRPREEAVARWGEDRIVVWKK